jgi:ABC-type arginine/histidine transport system permease subunit
MSTETVLITVRQSTGTYKTSMVRGCSASCTAGDANAAEALGRKLFGARFLSATQLPRDPHLDYDGQTQWRLEASA